MDLPLNQFKRAIVSGKTPIGAWLMCATPSTAEALGCVGFDFLVVDMEHTPIDTPQMIGILQAIAGTSAQAVVRPPWNDMVMVKRCGCRRADNCFRSYRTRKPGARSRGATAARHPRRRGTHRGISTAPSPAICSAPARDLCHRTDRAIPASTSSKRRVSSGRRFDFHRPGGSLGVDGFLGDIGNATVRTSSRPARNCKRLGKCAASSAPIRIWPASSRSTASRGSPSAPTSRTS